MDATPDQDAQAKPLFKGLFKSGYTSRTPHVRFVRLEDATQRFDLGPGWRDSRRLRSVETYRDLGPERSLRRVAELMGAPIETIAARSRVWRWVDRVRLWDQEQHRLHGTPTTREEAMRWRRKTERYGPDQRLWTRSGRQRTAWLRRTEARMRAIMGVESDELWVLVRKDCGLDGKTSR